jgi:hypothetical protein
MNLTGPLGKQYCLLFKLLTLFALFYAIVCMISLAYFLIYPPQNNNLIGILVLQIPVYLVIYIQNRLLYNICLQ